MIVPRSTFNFIALYAATFIVSSTECVERSLTIKNSKRYTSVARRQSNADSPSFLVDTNMVSGAPLWESSTKIAGIPDHRNLQRPQCNAAITNLFEESAALDASTDAIYQEISPVLDACTEFPCVFNESDDQYDDLRNKVHDDCVAAGGVVYQYDLYLRCSNSTGGIYDEDYWNMNYCYPPPFTCSTTDVEIIANSRMEGYAESIESFFSESNYECSYDVDFLRSFNEDELGCLRGGDALLDANPKFDAAADALWDEFSEKYSLCGRDPITDNCLLEENKLDGAELYFDECLAAGGRIWEYDFFITCTNSETNQEKTETIKGYDLCMAFDGCPINIVRSLALDDARNFAEQLEERLTDTEAGWTCERRIDPTRTIPGPLAPPGTPGSLRSSSSPLLFFVTLVVGIIATAANIII